MNQTDHIDATREQIVALLERTTDPDERRALKTHIIGVSYGNGMGRFVENLTQTTAMGMLADAYAKAQASGGLIVIEDPQLHPADFAALEMRVMKTMNEKQRNRSASALLAAAAAALFPPHLMGGQRREKKVKRKYGKCLCCGNPCRDSVCKKCQTGPTIELK